MATEGDDATLDFVVTLDPAAAAVVTVDYATSNGTATAGDDYTATSGTLTFAAGETTKTVSVPVLDDLAEDDGETVNFALSNASGAHIGDGAAVGTIRNTEDTDGILVSNLGQQAAPFGGLASGLAIGNNQGLNQNDAAVAVSFSTGGNTHGGSAAYSLSGVRIGIHSTVGDLSSTTLKVVLHKDGVNENRNVQPGDAIQEVGSQLNPQMGLLDLNTSSPIKIRPFTRYWLVFDLDGAPDNMTATLNLGFTYQDGRG